jgi:ubiquinone/menaquinone biosynthesis C-methylase UbiE
VRFIQHEISTRDLTTHFADNSIDVVTSFHCIEHLHGSPRLVLEAAMRVLKPKGIMIIEVPNAANVRKRLAVLCGRTNYGPLTPSIIAICFGATLESTPQVICARWPKTWVR